MLGFIILSVMASCFAAQEGMPRFTISGYSRSNVPEINVAFENGKTHEMILEPFSESSCNFIGELKSEPGSSVGVTGCLENPDDKMYITLLSDDNSLSYAYIMDYDGKVTADENPFKNQKGPSGLFSHDVSLRMDDVDDTNDSYGKHKDNMGDEEKDNYEEKQAQAASAMVTNWPTSIYAYLKLGYDNTLANQMRAQGTTFEKWIDSVMTHVQTYYRHKSLPTKIQLKYKHSETTRRWENLPSTESLVNWSLWAKKDIKNNPKVDLYVVFGKDANDKVWNTVGMAWVGGACRECNVQGASTPIWCGTSFNEWSRTPTATAATAAHEMGHNFGMSHDFDPKHGGQGGKCDGLGIMSYNSDKPMKWSDCSVKDFTGYFNQLKWGSTCLKNWSKYVPPCQDKCPDCGAIPNTICNNPNGYGDGTKDGAGCNGVYSYLFKEYCQKTCNFC